MVRTTVGTIAEAQLSVEQAETVSTINADLTTTVSSSGSNTTTITAPSGALLSVIGIRLLAPNPSGASSGSHRIQIQGPDRQVRYLFASSGFDDNIRINNGTIRTAKLKQLPSSTAAQAEQIRSIIADDTRGVNLTYTNLTDVDQDQTVTIRLIVLERGVSR